MTETLFRAELELRSCFSASGSGTEWGSSQHLCIRETNIELSPERSGYWFKAEPQSRSLPVACLHPSGSLHLSGFSERQSRGRELDFLKIIHLSRQCSLLNPTLSLLLHLWNKQIQMPWISAPKCSCTECSGRDLLGDRLLNGPGGKLQNWVVQGCSSKENASQEKKKKMGLVLGGSKWDRQEKPLKKFQSKQGLQYLFMQRGSRHVRKNVKAEFGFRCF